MSVQGGSVLEVAHAYSILPVGSFNQAASQGSSPCARAPQPVHLKDGPILLCRASAPLSLDQQRTT